MTAMDITIHASFLPHDDPDASLATLEVPGPTAALAFYTAAFDVGAPVGGPFTDSDGFAWEAASA
jgi:hypothetical protein